MWTPGHRIELEFFNNMQKELSNELVDQYIRVGTGPALHSDQQEIKQTLVTNPQLRIQILSPSRILVATDPADGEER